MAEGYDDELFARLAEVEDRSFWYRARARLIVDLLRRHFPRAVDVLEVGAGSGGVLAALRTAAPELRLTGGEPSAEGLALARARLPEDVELVSFDARSIPYDDAFDVVGAFDVLEHVDDDQGALSEMRKAARPGGGVLVLVPQHPRLWSDMDRIARHARRYRRRELVEKARRAGLDVEFVGSFVTTLLPALIASRALRRVLRRPYDPVAELEPRFLNRTLERVLDGERALIGRGVSLPVGATLILVARRPAEAA